MRHSKYTLLIIGLAIYLGSCSPPSSAQLQGTLYQSQSYLLPTSGFSCTDIRVGNTTPSIGPLLFDLGKMDIQWNDKSLKFIVSYIRMYTSDPNVSFECIIEGADLVYMATGQTVSSGSLIIDQNSKVTLPSTNALCKLSCGSVRFLDETKKKSIAVSIDIVGIDDSTNAKPYRTTLQSVVLPDP